MADRIRYYVDEHIPKTVVKGLRRRGVDVMTLQDSGMLGAEDDAHLRFALEAGRVVFTCDDDFLKLQAAGVEHAGIVYTDQRTTIGEMIFGLMLIYEVLDLEDMHEHVDFI